MCIKRIKQAPFSSECANLYIFHAKEKRESAAPRIDMRSYVADRRVHAVNQSHSTEQENYPVRTFLLTLAPFELPCMESFFAFNVRG
jgi:hypothetical protein